MSRRRLARKLARRSLRAGRRALRAAMGDAIDLALNADLGEAGLVVLRGLRAAELAIGSALSELRAR